MNTLQGRQLFRGITPNFYANFRLDAILDKFLSSQILTKGNISYQTAFSFISHSKMPVLKCGAILYSCVSPPGLAGHTQNCSNTNTKLFKYKLFQLQIHNIMHSILHSFVFPEGMDEHLPGGIHKVIETRENFPRGTVIFFF